MAVAWLTHPEDHRHPIRGQATRHERQRLRRLAIQPLTIVDDTDQRSSLRGVGEERQNGQADQEDDPAFLLEAERGAQRVALWTRQLRNPIQHRRTDLVQP